MKSLLSALLVSATLFGAQAQAQVSMDARELAERKLEILETSYITLVEIIAEEKGHLAQIKKLQAYQKNVATFVLSASGYMNPLQAKLAVEKFIPVLKSATSVMTALLEGQSNKALSLAFAALVKNPELRKLLGLDSDPDLKAGLHAQLENAEASMSVLTLKSRLLLLERMEAKAMVPFQEKASRATAAAAVGTPMTGWDLEKQSESLIELYEAQQLFLLTKISVLRTFLAN